MTDEQAVQPFAPREVTTRDGVRLLARPLTPDDASVWADHVRDDLEHLGAHLGWPARTVEPNAARDFIEQYRRRVDGRELLVGAFDGKRLVAGTLLMTYDRMAGSIELGCWVISDFEGRGLVRRLCLELIGHAHHALSVHRVTWEAATENPRSRALALRLGFVYEGTQREAGLHEGRRLDLDLLSLVGVEIERALGS